MFKLFKIWISFIVFKLFEMMIVLYCYYSQMSLLILNYVRLSKPFITLPYYVRACDELLGAHSTTIRQGNTATSVDDKGMRSHFQKCVFFEFEFVWFE